MNKTTLYLVFAFATCSYVTCQSCNGSVGFLTEQPTPGTNDEYFFLNLTAVANGTTPFGVTLNLLNDERLNVTADLMTGDIGIWSNWNLGANGGIGYGISFFGDSSDANQNASVLLYFNPPVTTVAMKTNYDPSYPTSTWGAPTFSIVENGSPVVCYDIGALAPISTPAATNGFAWRGVTNNEAGISALQLDGAQIVGWDVVIIRKYQAPPVTPPQTPPQTPQSAPVAAPVASPIKSNTPGKSSSGVELVASISTLIAAILVTV